MEVRNPSTGAHVTLKPDQVSHFNHFAQVLTRQLEYLDLSVMGSGKTYITDALAIHYGLTLLVICPKTAKGKWRQVIAETGARCAQILSYNSLRSVKSKNGEILRVLKHGLLERKDDVGRKSYFVPTDKFQQLVQGGILLVLDEIQNIKNNSSQFRACKALTTCILTQKATVSRFGLLSGSPFDKEEHVVNLLRLMGYIRNPQLFVFHRQVHTLKLLGAQELIDACCRFHGFEKTVAAKEKIKLNKTTVHQLCFRLFIDVIKPDICAAMASPLIDAVRDVKDGYYRLAEPDRQALITAIAELGRAARFNRNDQTIGQKDIEWGGITKALQHIELAKVPLLIRLAREKLQRNPKAKVIIFVSYIQSLINLCGGLNEFMPMCLYGQTKDSDRELIIKFFQEDDRYRLLVSNLRVGGASIDLHDTRGDRPRTIFIVPTYSILDLHQASYRAFRQGTRSTSTVRNVYGITGDTNEPDVLETSILRALAKKKDVLREVLDQQVAEGVKFPGDYPVEYEN